MSFFRIILKNYLILQETLVSIKKSFEYLQKIHILDRK